jgi:hypothetical protein
VQDRQCDLRGKPQREFLFRGQCREQHGQAFAAGSLAVIKQRLTRLGDGDEGDSAVVGVSESGHQALALQPLDQLSHRRLADAFLGSQRGKPRRAFSAHSVQ